MRKLKETAEGSLAGWDKDKATPPPRRVGLDGWLGLERQELCDRLMRGESFVEAEDPGTHAHWAEHVHPPLVHPSPRPHIEHGLLKPNGTQAGSQAPSDRLLMLHRRRCRPGLECFGLQPRADTKSGGPRASATAVGGEGEIGRNLSPQAGEGRYRRSDCHSHPRPQPDARRRSQTSRGRAVGALLGRGRVAALVRAPV